MEQESELKKQAHLGFQMAKIQGAQLEQFKDYLEAFGLGEKVTAPELTPEEIKATQEKLKKEFYDFTKDMKL